MVSKITFYLSTQQAPSHPVPLIVWVIFVLDRAFALIEAPPLIVSVDVRCFPAKVAHPPRSRHGYSLWPEEFEFGAGEKDEDLVPLILEVCEDVRTAYRPFAEAKDKSVTDTLVTKVVLGTMGCFPALDVDFVAGYRSFGFSVPDPLNSTFIEGVLRFCRNNLQDFKAEQARIEEMYRMRCPLMKLVDAYFVKIGEEIEAAKPKKPKKQQAELLAG